MNRLITFLLVLVLTATSGCGAWWQRFRENPVAVLTEGTGYMVNALSLAELAFNAWAAGNPAATPETRAQFMAVVGHARRGIAVAQAGLRTAATLQRDELDVDRLLRDAQGAVTSVATFLRGLSTPNGSAQDPMMATAIQHLEASSEPIRRP